MNIKYHRINESELSSLPFNEGSMYFCKDTGKLYADPIGGGGTHILINDNINDISTSTNSTWSSNKINESITNTKTELNQSMESSVNSAKTELSLDYNNKIKLAAPVNLLDNSDFTNPVNQRGQNSYTGDFIYTIDRWRLGNNGESVEVLDKSIKLTSNNYGFIYQSLPKLCKGSYTFVCKFVNNTGTVTLTNYWTDSGLATSQSSSDPSGKIYLNFTLDEDVTDPGYTFLRISLTTVGSVEILNAALYEGEYTADTLPEYRPKGYGVELNTCLMFFERLGNAYSVILSNLTHIKSGSKSGIFTINFNKKRIIPTIRFSDSSQYRILFYFNSSNMSMSMSATGISEITDITATKEMGYFTAKFINDINADCNGLMQRQDDSSSAWIDISADL